MLHLHREVVPALEFERELPVQRHAVMALVRGIGVGILAIGALGMFFVGAMALGTVVFFD
jgi:hypothetical protein